MIRGRRPFIPRWKTPTPVPYSLDGPSTAGILRGLSKVKPWKPPAEKKSDPVLLSCGRCGEIAVWMARPLDRLRDEPWRFLCTVHAAELTAHTGHGYQLLTIEY